MTGRWLKKAFLIGVTLAAVVVLAPAPPPTQHFPDRQRVVFWHMWGNEYQPIVERIAKRFNESQAKYEVVPMYVPADGSMTKFLLSASGGKAPDLVSQWNPVLGTWTDRGLITPLEEVMTPEEEARYRREAYPIMQSHATYKGKLMAMIAGVDVTAVFYRLDHLREVGVDKEHLPKTLEELMALAQRLDRKDARGRLRRVGFLPSSWKTLVPCFGGSFGTSERMKFDTPENRRAAEFVVGNQKRLGFENVSRFVASQAADTGMTQPLIAGNFSMLLDGQWRVGQTAKFAPDLDYAVGPVPPPKGGKPSASMTDPNYLMIPRASSCPKGAWAFMKYWIGMDDAESGGRNVADMDWLPYCDRVAGANVYQAYLRKYPRFRTFVDLVASPNLQKFPVTSLQSFVTTEVDKAVEATGRGTISPEKALAGLEATVADEKARQRRLGNVR
ncbi:extracellular solute-binding protein [bacterium]|nr:MAG: extracellular solute-binding protein [bacterium]